MESMRLQCYTLRMEKHDAATRCEELEEVNFDAEKTNEDMRRRIRELIRRL